MSMGCFLLGQGVENHRFQLYYAVFDIVFLWG